jgi:hypothetical protein
MNSLGAVIASSGSGTNSLFIQSNPFLDKATDTEAAVILSKVGGFAYAPVTCEMFVENGLEVGTIATFGSTASLVMHIESSQDGAVASSVGNDNRSAYNNSIMQLINGAISGIAVGGRNLAPLSHWFGGASRSIYSDNDVDTFSTTARGFPLCHTSDILAPLAPSSAGIGEDIVVSFDFKIDSGGDASHTIGFYAYQQNGVSINITNSISDKGILTSDEKNTSWTRVARATQARNWGDNGSYTIGCIYIYDNTGSNNFSVRNVKIERGNKATDWTPAPEDVDDDIAAASTTATNYITEVGNSGIKVHAEGDTDNYSLIDGDGMEVYKNGTGVAAFGDTVRLGKSTGTSRMELDYHSLKLIDDEGVDFVNLSDLRDENGEAEITETFIMDGSQTGVSLAVAPTSITSVEINGTATSAYTWSGGSVVRFSTAPSAWDKVSVAYVTEDEWAKAYTFGRRQGTVGLMSFAEGAGCIAAGAYSHAEGSAKAEGRHSHAEGVGSSAVRQASHAEGNGTTANGAYSHAEGNGSIANGENSHAQNLGTIAEGNAQTAIGMYNVADSSSLFLIGHGTDDNARVNALKVDSSNNLRLKGNVYVGCNDDSSGGSLVRIWPTVIIVSGGSMTFSLTNNTRAMLLLSSTYAGGSGIINIYCSSGGAANGAKIAGAANVTISNSGRTVTLNSTYHTYVMIITINGTVT